MTEEKKDGTIFEGDLEKEGVKSSGHTHDEPEEHEQSSEELKEDMASGEEDEDVYTEEGRENLVEDDEISPEEEGFMQGAEGKGKKQKEDKEEVIEEEKVPEEPHPEKAEDQ